MSDLHSTTPAVTTRDHTGEIFNRLTVVERLSGSPTKYLCICACGRSKTLYYANLKNGSTQSCGCLIAEVAGKHAITHGRSRSIEYESWHAMWQRCTNPKHKSYLRYKDRAPPEEWRDFSVFLAHIGPRPDSGLSLDRIDNDKPYGPGNVRWATAKEQCNNRINNHLITYAGSTKTLAQWSAAQGLPKNLLRGRLVRQGWTVEKALTTPPRPVRRRL